MANLPSFNGDGLLPAGDYDLTLAEMKESVLVLGPREPQVCLTWDSAWRETLVDQLGVLAGQLREVGISNIYINGSFVEEKDHPNDIDGYFDCDFRFLVSGELSRKLNLLNEHKVWTWDPASRRPYRGYPKKQLPMWHKYRVELYPHYHQSSGITDQFGNQLEFPAAFRQSRRDGKPKGIVRLMQ